MAFAPVLPVLLVATITKGTCEAINGYSHNSENGATQFGELLKPPPPPLSNIVPVPFHGGAGRTQKQNGDIGYFYQPPPPPPISSPIHPSNDFKFPAPFYKQYNFNFVPPPQPFSSTPSPSLFNKVSGWLFPSQQTSYDATSVFSSNNVAPVKKDCNPCNLVPWIPVLRYNLAGKNNQQSNPTYGPPSPTAFAQNVVQYHPQPFLTQNQDHNLQLSTGIPHLQYGPPLQANSGPFKGAPGSTYGPPSPTHTIDIPSQSPLSSPYSAPSTSFSLSSSSYNAPGSLIGQSFGAYDSPSSSYGVPSSTSISTSPYAIPSTSYATPHPLSTYGSVASDYDPNVVNNNLPTQNVVDVQKELDPGIDLQQKLPKVRNPSGFKNSYGEPITNIFDIPYSVSATAAESTKIKAEVLPNSSFKSSTPNMSLALANPAPFTLNRGRNIHTLQPVALPNLSVSPLPPIFNARPFRPIPKPKFPNNLLQGINQLELNSNKINTVQSIPIAEYTHSVDYPASVIQSPVIDIDIRKTVNQSKTYRNIANGFIVDDYRDISSQASEDHVSATKSNQDSSFESTGNDLYDTNIPADLKQIYVPSNHKPEFADLRGIKDKDVDKYRTESNLQNIDSPLLYLKPSAPHKKHGNFVLAVTTQSNDNEYEIYDDIPTTIAPQLSTLTSAWDESRNDYNEDLFPPPNVRQDENQPKIVQIIVPYTTGQEGGEIDDFRRMPHDWGTMTSEDEYQGRKIPSKTETSIETTVTESYPTTATLKEEPQLTVTESNNDLDHHNTPAILNDVYDVKEPPFDIIKLQHTIDDWTQQEYSRHYNLLQRTRTSAKYAKQIPDEYFTTTSPLSNYATTNYNFEFYDHEGSSSIQHSVTDEKNNTNIKPRKEYNTIERVKNTYNGKNEKSDEVQKLHIYTAASSFRKTTTPAPWETIQTSISPLTKEKVYVVTSKPWREHSNEKKEWYEIEPFESKRTKEDNEDVINSDKLKFKSPRFSNRPSFGFTAKGDAESLQTDSSYGFSKSWYQSINDLETRAQDNNTTLPEGALQKVTTNTDEDTIATTTAEPLDDYN